MNELYHYGVKGQKWGVRRKRKSVDRIVNKAYKKYEQYGVKAHRALSKQQKLQSKRFSKMNKLREQGKIEESNKYSKMTDKEKRLYRKFVNSVNTGVSLREFSYAFETTMNEKLSNISKGDIKRGRDTIDALVKHNMNRNRD